MFRVDRSQNRLSRRVQKRFSDLNLRERDHLQEWLANQPDALGEELLIIQKEFDGFDETRERLDLLALDVDAQRIVTAGADNSIKVWDVQTGHGLYTLLGGSLQLRGAARAHPTRPGCSSLVYDENRIVGSFANILKSFNFTND